ncbi:MAG: aldo/keto reductase [Lachnospiraceae bacterium]|nr:aldo/keto reductase [Lachnospiraceae bacterium]
MLQGKRVTKLLDAALDAGINTFDTAENYGASEQMLGKWIKKRKNRDKVVIITKGCHPYGKPRVNAEALKCDLEQSFKRLKTDYIDIYMLHRDHPEADIKAILEILNEYHKAGKIGAFGASNWTHQRIEEVNRYATGHDLVPFTVSSPNFGPAKQVDDPWGGGCVSISGADNADVRKWYQENRIPVFAYSCLGRGMFSGKVRTEDLEHTRENMDKYAIKGYWCQENIERLACIEKIAKERGKSVAQISLAWIMQQEVQAFPIVTISDSKRIAENADAVNIKLSDAELKAIMEK